MIRVLRIEPIPTEGGRELKLCFRGDKHSIMGQILVKIGQKEVKKGSKRGQKGVKI